MSTATQPTAKKLQFTIRWVSGARWNKAHAQIQNVKSGKYQDTAICGIGFTNPMPSKRPHCITCMYEITEYKKDGWIVIEVINE